MTRYLLDTNAVIALLNDAESPLGHRARQHKPADICISSVVAHELFYGAFKSQRAAYNVTLVDSLQFEVLEFDKDDARQAGEIRAHLALKGTPIGPYDVLIAGQAKARNLTLVTGNTDEFKRVGGTEYRKLGRQLEQTRGLLGLPGRSRSHPAPAPHQPHHQPHTAIGQPRQHAARPGATLPVGGIQLG